MVVDIDYRKFSNRVCNWREAGFIGISFAVAVGIVGAILLGIYLGTGCPAGQTQCKYEGKCIPNDQFCDGVQNCEIGDDEWVCAPTKFYVSFRTNVGRTGREYMAGLVPDSEDFNATAKVFNKEISYAFGNSSYGAAYRNTKVFRFRFVNKQGQEYNSTDDGFDGSLTVDSFVEFSGNKSDRIKLLDPQRITDVIRNATGYLRGIDATIDERTLDPVTTGVAIVLEAPKRKREDGETDEDMSKKNCRQTRVYCQNYCPGPEDESDEKGDFYQHGSTKGCPECICAKLTGNFPLPK